MTETIIVIILAFAGLFMFAIAPLMFSSTESRREEERDLNDRHYQD